MVLYDEPQCVLLLSNFHCIKNIHNLIYRMVFRKHILSLICMEATYRSWYKQKTNMVIDRPDYVNQMIIPPTYSHVCIHVVCSVHDTRAFWCVSCYIVFHFARKSCVNNSLWTPCGGVHFHASCDDNSFFSDSYSHGRHGTCVFKRLRVEYLHILQMTKNTFAFLYKLSNSSYRIAHTLQFENGPRFVDLKG